MRRFLAEEYVLHNKKLKVHINLAHVLFKVNEVLNLYLKDISKKREKNSTLQESVRMPIGIGDIHWGTPKPRKKPIEFPNGHVFVLHHQ